MRFSLIPFLLLVLPMAEIAMFIIVGNQIGVLATLGLIVATAIIGSILLRVQGLGLLQAIATETNAGRVPGRELVHGVMILLAGVLLLTPGFVTDTIGLLLFIPKVRELGWRLLKDRITVVVAGRTMGAGGARPAGRGSAGNGRRNSAGEPVIELDEGDFQRDPSPESPWQPENQRPEPSSSRRDRQR